MKKKIKPFNKDYPGFESAFDIERDIMEWLEDTGLWSSEFTGTVKVSLSYEEATDEEE